MSGADITCRGVAKKFGDLDAVAPLSLSFAAGKTTAIVGPSGCGKSTVLRMIAGLEVPSEGEILIGSETPSALAKRGGLAMAFQDPSLLPWRTVRTNITLGAKLARKPVGDVDALIRLVGLEGFADTKPAALSGGMRQRAAIARALISTPEVLLLDEPFGAVDAITRSRLNVELPPLWRETGTTAILVTHAVIEAVMLADRILVMSPRPGAIIADIAVTLEGKRREQDTAFQSIANQTLAALQDAI
ncbi:NitT/TauT family transport system ATP-binding protein [Cognatiyoonia koreensis]|uniref:NitT/TauT family transport system ATP-binding protein n=1 Tax=Cognatiyoonia koreensis TaxID=364200 RepID=A0A1I0QYV6_9RHOB|nr:ABC transporter ATP-binding protein [Cognatiyoonia koreensis]SEW32291.1 NitT/TauT family transport system ATP-binding protein [Cognatiyoonia koreensis]